MRVIKKINNNVVVCKDGNGQQLIAMGKGIGFPKTPYDLNDLSKIEMTFYRVSERTESMLASIPEKIIFVSYQILRNAQQELNNNFSQNIVFSLADHINFAIIRAQKNINFDFSLAYDVEHLYPEEYKVGKNALNLIDQKLKVKLPESEATAIALHFINAREIPIKNIDNNLDYQLLQIVLTVIEDTYGMKLNLKSFAFNRFKIHFKYYLDRVQSNKQISGEITPKLVKDFREENPKAAKCAERVVEILDKKLHSQTTDDEMFYLMVYVNRMINKTRGIKNE